MWTPNPSDITTASEKAFAVRAQRLAAFKSAFDAHLDLVAQQRQYDSRVTIVGYIASTNPQWAAEANAFAAWRDGALGYMFDQLTAVEAGEIAAPSIEDFIAGMPAIEWPGAAQP
jgi:hypothetical protein